MVDLTVVVEEFSCTISQPEVFAVEVSPELSINLESAYLQGPAGPPGDRGPAGGLEIQSAEADEAIQAGQPLYLKANGKVGLACAATPLEAQVCGYALSSAVATFAIEFLPSGIASSNDWSAISGSPTLSPGAEYYLSLSPGQISSVAPTTGYIVSVGRALTPTKLAFEIQPTIKL